MKTLSLCVDTVPGSEFGTKQIGDLFKKPINTNLLEAGTAGSVETDSALLELAVQADPAFVPPLSAQLSLLALAALASLLALRLAIPILDVSAPQQLSDIEKGE
jgi:hypothetical protein